jgi:hypothetical protein
VILCQGSRRPQKVADSGRRLGQVSRELEQLPGSLSSFVTNSQDNQGQDNNHEVLYCNCPTAAVARLRSCCRCLVELRGCHPQHFQQGSRCRRCSQGEVSSYVDTCSDRDTDTLQSGCLPKHLSASRSSSALPTRSNCS